jgi:hypothetical protein
MSIPESIKTSRHFLRGSVTVLLIRITVVTFLIETVYALLLLTALGSSWLADYAAIVVAVLWFIHLIKFFIQVVIVDQIVAKWATTVYYVTDNYLIRYKGAVSVNEHIFDLHNLKTMTIQQSWLGKMVNYGDIFLCFTASTYQEEVTIVGINDPKKYEQYFQKYIAAD